jgi:phosphatidylglycerophosphate synthase
MLLLQVSYINFILFLIIYLNITDNSHLSSIVVTVLIAFIFTFFTGVGIVINISNNKSNKEVK